MTGAITRRASAACGANGLCVGPVKGKFRRGDEGSFGGDCGGSDAEDDGNVGVDSHVAECACFIREV